MYIDGGALIPWGGGEESTLGGGGRFGEEESDRMYIVQCTWRYIDVYFMFSRSLAIRSIGQQCLSVSDQVNYFLCYLLCFHPRLRAQGKIRIWNYKRSESETKRSGSATLVVVTLLRRTRTLRLLILIFLYNYERTFRIKYSCQQIFNYLVNTAYWAFIF